MLASCRYVCSSAFGIVAQLICGVAEFLLTLSFRRTTREVLMSGGPRLLLVFLFCCVLAVAVFASDATVANAPAGPPLAPQKPVTDVVQAKKIIDPYRWLEDASSTDTKRWVNDELGYTRA